MAGGKRNLNGTEKKVCSKCGNEVIMPLYVERKRLFRKKTKKWCFSCYNKLRFSAGKLELKEVVITGAKLSDNDKDLNIPIEMAPNIHLDSNIKNKEDSEPKLTTFGIIDSSTGKDISKDMEIQIHADNKEDDCTYLDKKYYTCSHVENIRKLCNSYNCPIKLKKRFRHV